jgi:hypothetical protein
MCETSLKYQPIRDKDERVIEKLDDYVRRMKQNVLQNWPEEVSREWLYRHPDCINKYAFLNFETFSFSKEVWIIEQLPGREAFKNENFCDNFSDVEKRAERPNDWLANYMLRAGTWNTPIVLLYNKTEEFIFPDGESFKKPFHLLEGHRRLSFLVGLNRIGKAQPKHEVWLVTKSI